MASPPILGQEFSSLLSNEEFSYFSSHSSILVEKDKQPSDRSRGNHKRSMPRDVNLISGLFNEGATCYLNSVLQCLLQCGTFSRSVLAIEDDDSLLSQNPILRTLQALYAAMLMSNQHAVRTESLLKSFGWSKEEVFQQHDAHELFSLLFSAIEGSISTKLQPAVSAFQGDEESTCIILAVNLMKHHNFHTICLFFSYIYIYSLFSLPELRLSPTKSE